MQRRYLLNNIKTEAEAMLTETGIRRKHQKESRKQFSNLSFMCHHNSQHALMLGECRRSTSLLDWNRKTISLYGTIQDMASGKIKAGVPELNAALQSLATHGATLGSIYDQGVGGAPGVQRPPPCARALRLSTAPPRPTGPFITSAIATPTTVTEDALTRRRNHKQFLTAKLKASLSEHESRTIPSTPQSKDMANTEAEKLLKLSYFNRKEEVDAEWMSILERLCAVKIREAEIKAQEEEEEDDDEADQDEDNNRDGSDGEEEESEDDRDKGKEAAKDDSSDSSGSEAAESEAADSDHDQDDPVPPVPQYQVSTTAQTQGLGSPYGTQLQGSRLAYGTQTRGSGPGYGSYRGGQGSARR
jgi:chemotaxis protein histidine kinase CheA